jgi:hypothetical protein
VWDTVEWEVLYNIIFELVIEMRQVRLINYLNGSYSRVRIGKTFSDIFPLRNVLREGDALLPLLFKCALYYSNMRVQVIQNGLKLLVHIESRFMLMILISGCHVYILYWKTQRFSRCS